MSISFRFLAGTILGLAVLQLIPCAHATPPPPVPKERTVAVFGEAVAGTVKLDVRNDAEAITGRYVAPSKNYQVVATAPVPSEGATLHVWIRYRGLALQMKTRIGEKTAEFPWSWARNTGAFGWRKAGGFVRSQLGSSVFFMCDNKLTPESGVDAVVVTADASWHPPGTPAPVAALDPDMPDAANATVTLAAAAPAESSDPGSAEVRIDWTKTGVRIPPFLYSLNNFRGTNVERMSSPAWHAGTAYMAPRLLRIHNAGLVKAWFDPAAGTWDREKIRAALEAGRPPAGTERMININGWPDSFDSDNDRRLDPGRVDDYARLCADLVRIVNGDLKAGVSYWEVTNEKDFAYWRKPAPGLSPDVPALAAIYNAAAAAMRAVDPAIKIGGPAACNPLPVEPLIEFAVLAREQLDFLSFHNYASGSADETDQTIYEKVSVMARDTADAVRRLKKAVPGKDIEVHLNEHNICYSWRVPEPRMTDHKGAVFDALSLIAYAQIPGLTATNAWNDQDRVYGKMDHDGALRPGAHVYHYFNTLLVGAPAASATTAAKAVVPFAIADGRDGRPAFVLVNRTNGAQTVTLSETPAHTGSWRVAAIDAAGHRPDASADPFSAPVTLSPHSVHFYWLN